MGNWISDSGLEVGQGLRVDDNVNFGSTTYSSDLNDHVKIGAMIDNFMGSFTLQLWESKNDHANIEDVTSADWTLPKTDFILKTPDEGATIVADADVTPTWSATIDLDGNTVRYEKVLYLPDSTEFFAAPSNNDGLDTEITVPATLLDELLVSAGVGDGESVTFLWNVRVNDGVDTLAVSSGYDVDTNTFTPIYRTLHLPTVRRLIMRRLRDFLRSLTSSLTILTHLTQVLRSLSIYLSLRMFASRCLMLVARWQRLLISL